MANRPRPSSRVSGLVPVAVLVALVAAVLVAAPSGADVAVPPEATVLAGLRPGHPRLILTADTIGPLKARIAAEPTTGAWYGQVKARATALLGTPVLTYTKPDEIRLLETSRAAVRRLYDLGLVWLVDGDPAIRDRAWAELDAVTRFPDWNPLHFLDTAEMTHAVAIGYDWLYDGLTPAQRSQVEQAIITMGLGPARDSYTGNMPLAVSYWTVVDHNWNNVVNGGEAIGALAVADIDPSLAAFVAHEALVRLPSAYRHYGPDGGWPEGVGYWEYATEYTVAALASLQSALGHDFGLSAMAGLDRTGDVPIHMTAPSGERWEWADDGQPRNAPSVPAMFWLADRYGHDAYRAYQVAHAEPHALDVVWYSPPTGPSEPLPLDRLFAGIDVATSRTAWDDATATWVGAKGGDAGFNHNQLDLGSFVLDRDGQRFAMDLGREDYGVAGYFQSWPGGPRWDYYRSRAEGHNTLVIDPDACEDQDPRAVATITRWASGPDESFSVIDLTNAYRGTPVQRGVALSNRTAPGGPTVLLVDQLDFTDAPATHDVWWFLHTRAQLQLSPDRRTATFTLNGHTLRASLLAPSDATFSIEAAVPLPSSPHPAGNDPNTGIRKLAIHLTAAGATTISVAFDGGTGEPPTPPNPPALWHSNGATASVERTAASSPLSANPCKGITAADPTATPSTVPTVPVATPGFTG